MELFRRSRGGEAGSVAVEFALFLPLFLMLVFSIIELGGAWYTKQLLVNASREGARAGSLYEPDDGQENIQDLVLARLSNAGYGGSAAVDISGLGGASGDPVSVTVSTDYNFPVLGALISGLTGTISLTATTVMRHE